MNALKRVCVFIGLSTIIQPNFWAHGMIRPPGIDKRVSRPVLAKEGVLNIGHLLGMSSYDVSKRQCGVQPRPFSCGSLFMGEYVIDQINRRNDLLPNITLGLINVDGCFTDMKALEVSTFFINDEHDLLAPGKIPNDRNSTSAYANSSWKTKKLYSTELKSYDVVGVVGPLTTREATAVSSLMSVFEIPIIGTYPTGDDLSDKSRYEYFLRVVAPDRFQILALLGIAKYFDWTYVSVVYAEGSYGENGVKQFDHLLQGPAANYGICVAVTIKILASADEDDFAAAAETLIRNRKARVVFLLVDYTSVVDGLFKALMKKNEFGTYIWLGTDPMAALSLVANTQTMLNGAIFVDHSEYAMPEFDDYLETINPSNSQDNVWVMSLWESVNGCTFSSDTNQTCSMNLTLDSTTCMPQRGLANRVHDAFTIFAHALHNYISETCPQVFAEKTDTLLVRQCIRGPDLLSRIKDMTYEGVMGRLQFNADGDFVENLVVKQYYLTSDGETKWKEVGVWNATELSVQVQERDIQWPNNLSSSDDFADRTPMSVCSLPCLDTQYVIRQSSSCCWICGNCRENEILLQNRTGCQSCPLYSWPDDVTSTTCVPIDPVYFQWSHPISIALLCMAAVIAICGATSAGVFLRKRQQKLVKAISIQLSLLILLGILVVSITVVVHVAKPDASKWLCIVRTAGFHIGINMIYAPLLVKNVRIYRIFAAGKKSIRAPRFISTEVQLIFVAFLFFIQVCIGLHLRSLRNPFT